MADELEALRWTVGRTPEVILDAVGADPECEFCRRGQGWVCEGCALEAICAAQEEARAVEREACIRAVQNWGATRSGVAAAGVISGAIEAIRARGQALGGAEMVRDGE